MRQSADRKVLLRQFFMFGCVGTAGFLVDSAVLMAMLKLAHTGLYSSRVVSFLCAVTFTWAANRIFTFREHSGRDHPALAQWIRFVCVNAVGAAVNLGSYAVLVSHVDTVARQPVIGVAVGSIAGLLFNFVLSRWLVFRSHSAGVPARPTRTT
jgi:putative flippase GtrA